MASKKVNNGFKFASKASAQPKNKRKGMKLDPIRNQFRSLVVRANELISQLRESGSLGKSQTYRKFFGERSDGQFNIDDKHRFIEIRREVNKINEFLTAEDNTVSGADYVDKVLRAVSEHEISFSNQNIDASGNRFADKDQDKIKFAMKIYRQIAETEYLAIGKQKGQFGSDNLINLIYDEIEGYDPNMALDEKNMIERRAMEVGYAVLNKFKMNTLMGFLSGSPNESTEVNIVEQLKKSQSADEYFRKNPWLRNNNF